MSVQPIRLPALLLVTLSLTLPCSAFAAIKCWTNKEGTRECGNVVPPEYAQQETRTINTRGITVEVQERAKTTEELEKEQEEVKRKEEEKKRQEEQATYDRMLMSSFTTEQDLLKSRDRASSALDATIELTGASVNQLNRKLEEHKRRAAGLERAGTPVPADLREDMTALEKQIEDKNTYIGMKKLEKDQLLLKYEADLKRYRELKATRPR